MSDESTWQRRSPEYKWANVYANGTLSGWFDDREQAERFRNRSQESASVPIMIVFLYTEEGDNDGSDDS